ncbi:GNAT family N-acetyltransferase [Paenibacillus sp. J5C_2022]|uniref:GNAT family N-acetyltransferase n=1 Tax=Paenibacillus sp. J5C2022 TaxID=2977129 RepID=UPI0021D2A913|nr:GNAT family N-acetyltransferase [Paenibacillus sp. J5C2022]MCU6707258.1 GNAT family N-acetyltransferase [Paenibacillus sp. J5C2022]
MIAICEAKHKEDIYDIINDAATAYEDVIPADMYHSPYMPLDELEQEIGNGVEFWGYSDDDGQLLGVMGIQDKGDVALIRHAYVRTNQRNGGIGGKLLGHLIGMTDKPILIGTWQAAEWAIRFYEKHGFRVTNFQEKEQLLRQYWTVSTRQIDTSVVLCDERWTRG